MKAEWGTVGESLSEETRRMRKKTQTNCGGDTNQCGARQSDLRWQAFQLWTNTSEVRRGTNRKDLYNAGIQATDAGSENLREKWKRGEMRDLQKKKGCFNFISILTILYSLLHIV